jgi:hypothetical protein
MRAGATSEDDIVTLQVDLDNAFNTFSRAEMLEEVSVRCPELSRFSWYGSWSQLWIAGASPEEPPVLSCAAGGPLGPSVLRTRAATHSGAPPAPPSRCSLRGIRG